MATSDAKPEGEWLIGISYEIDDIDDENEGEFAGLVMPELEKKMPDGRMTVHAETGERHDALFLDCPAVWIWEVSMDTPNRMPFGGGKHYEGISQTAADAMQDAERIADIHRRVYAAFDEKAAEELDRAGADSLICGLRQEMESAIQSRHQGRLL